MKFFMKNHFLMKLFFFNILCFVTGCQGIFHPIPDEQEIRLRNAIRINPLHELGYVRLAQYLKNNERYSKTFSVLRTGQKHIPDSIALIRMEGGLLQALGFYKESQKYYTKNITKNPDEPLLYLDRAQLYLRLEKQQLALNDARKALYLKTNLFEALYLIGVILDQKTVSNVPNQSEQALEALISASKINGTNPDLWLRISTLWERRGEIRQAKLAMLRAVEISPETKLFLRRYVVLQEKELDQTIQKFSTEIEESLHRTLHHMLKLFPDDTWVHAHIGNLAWIQGKFELAETHLLRALEANSTYPWANFRLGVVYLSQKKWESALQFFDQGLKDDPKNHWAILQSGHALEMLGKSEDAISRYEWLLENGPDDLIVVKKLNRLYWNEFLFEKGEEVLLRGLEKFPAETEIIEKLLAYYESRRLFEKATKIILGFIEAKPDNTAALAKLGFYEKKLKHTEKALYWFKKALASSPEFEWAHIQQIEILLNTDREDEAENALNNFLKLKPNSEWALLKMSQLKLKQKHFDEAEALLEKCITMYPYSVGILKTQGRLYELQNRWIEAENIFKRLLKNEQNNSLILTHLGFTQWKLEKTVEARHNITLALYENPGSVWAWNLFLLLQPEEQQLRWIGNDLKMLLPVLSALASQSTEEAWQEITTVRTDPFTRQVLKNMHYLLEDAPQEIKMDPEDMTSKKLSPWINEQWGYFHDILGNRVLAARHFEVVLEALPDNKWIHARLGWVYERLGNLEKSKYHYTIFLQKHPQAFDICFRLANIYTLSGNETKTIELYEIIADSRPKHDLVLNNLAWLYLTAQDRKIRNLEKGMKLALKSVELNPTIDSLDTLAEAYFQSGDKIKALETIQKAARQAHYTPNRHSYLRKQLLRFRKGEQDSNPPALS